MTIDRKKLYRHYRNQKDYAVVCVAQDHETETELVVYYEASLGSFRPEALGIARYWVRSLVEFEEKFHVQ